MEQTTEQAVEHERFGGWCILELLGHRRLAGYVQEVEIAGQGVLRIDVPGTPPATQFYSVAAVYCITPTTEEIARALTARSQPQLVTRYELPAAPAQTPVCTDCGEAIPHDTACISLGKGEFRCVECQAAIDEEEARLGGVNLDKPF